MTEAHLPPTGSIKVVKQKKAAKIVERVARDTEDPEVPTERLLIVLDIDGTILLEDETLSPGIVEAVGSRPRPTVLATIGDRSGRRLSQEPAWSTGCAGR